MRPTAAAEVYDPGAQRSKLVGSLAAARYKHAVVALRDGRVVVIGGSDHRDRDGKLASVEIFDPATKRFTPAGRLRAARYKIEGAVELVDGRILIAGGAPRAELYDPATMQSEFVGPSIGKTLNFATTSLFPDGRVLVAGGYDENGIEMNRQAWIVTVPRRAGSVSPSAGS